MSASKMDALRLAFVERQDRPIYKELAEEFNVPLGTVTRTASDEGWTSLRAAYLERKAKDCDAMAIVLESVKIDRTIIAAFGDMILIGVRKIGAVLESIPEDRAASTQMGVVNDASFALKNFADAAKSVGIVGVSRLFGENGKEDNGRWNPQMLSQINLTVQNLVSQAGGKTPGDLPLTKVETAAPKPEIPTGDQAVT